MSDRGTSSPWQQNATWVFHRVLGLLLLAGLLLAYRELIAPLVIAALLAYVLTPAADLLARKTRVSRKWSARLVYIGALASVAIILVFLVPEAVREARILSDSLALMEDRLLIAGGQMERLLGFHVPLGESWVGLENQIARYFTPENIFPVILNVTSSGVWLLVILVVTYYLLVDWEQIREWLIGLAPAVYQEEIRSIHAEVKLIWHAYLRGEILMMLIVGVSSAAGAAILGLPNALILGLIAGFLELIPSLGPAAATTIAAISAWTRGSSFLPLSSLWLTALVVAVFVFVQLVQSVWIQPRVLSWRLHLHPGLIFVAVLSSLVISGALLAVIIVPLIGSAVVVARYLRRGRGGPGPMKEDESELPTVSAETPQDYTE